MIKIPLQVNTALKILCDNGKSAYVVGGAVRDAIMGKSVHDWDITTSALPEETMALFKEYRVIETGIKHGTVTVVIDGMSIEITTFRIDGGYSDNRHPDEVLFTDRVEDDLSRRDFTMNAVAVSMNGEIKDVFGGVEDIGKRIIRCVGEPQKRFEEDALRILRALRFSSVLDFEIEENTAESIHKCKNLLKNVSSDRIFAELCKLLCGCAVERILNDYRDVIFVIFPDLKASDGCVQNNPYHYLDVWGHIAKSVASAQAHPVIRLAMLFHDSGKPSVKETDENGVDHFYNHAKISRVIAERALTEMKASNKIKEQVCNLVEYHGFCAHKISKKTYRRYIASFGIDTVKMLFEVRKADILALSDSVIDGALKENEMGTKIFSEIEDEESCFKIKDLKINGNDLKNAGFGSSPLMGEVLKRLLNDVIDEKIINEKEALLKAASEYYASLKGEENNGNS